MHGVRSLCCRRSFLFKWWCVTSLILGSRFFEEKPSLGTEISISTVVKDGKRFLLQKLNKCLGSSTDKAGPLTIHRISLDRANSQNSWEFGTPRNDKQNKVIMMVGETGSGKTTLINTMVNFIFGVEWKDDYRIQLLEDSSKKSQASSQTLHVTTYQINHEDNFRIPYSITIIDTPGFGDTRGINYDEKIMQKIREFFQTCKFTKIDAICFVVQSSLARLTPTQEYIYDNVLSILGNYIKNNIIFFTTFADVQKPSVLSAIVEADVPCAKSEDGQPVYFKVNNSMLYKNNRPDEEDEDEDVCLTHEIQWKMGMKNIDIFLLHFLPGIASKDLILSNEVLAERNALEITLDGLVQKIEEVTGKQHELEQTERAVSEHKAEAEKNQNFKFEVSRVVRIKINSPEYSINCCLCKSTCHQDCTTNDDFLVYFCFVFNMQGTCRVCGHDYRVHISQKSQWITVVELCKISYTEVKEKYEDAEKKAMTPEDVLKKLKDDIEKAVDESLKLIQKVARILNRLQEIALKPNPVSAVDYIRLLIQREQQEGKIGFKERIKLLEENIRRFKIICKIQSQGDNVSIDNILSQMSITSDTE